MKNILKNMIDFIDPWIKLIDEKVDWWERKDGLILFWKQKLLQMINIHASNHLRGHGHPPLSFTNAVILVKNTESLWSFIIYLLFEATFVFKTLL